MAWSGYESSAPDDYVHAVAALVLAGMLGLQLVSLIAGLRRVRRIESRAAALRERDQCDQRDDEMGWTTAIRSSKARYRQHHQRRHRRP